VKTQSFFCHPLGIAESTAIGEGTRVWAWAHVMEGATLGSNCNVGEHCFIERGVVIGNDVVIKNGVAVWAGLKIEDRVFVGPNAVFTNDLNPRSKQFKPTVETFVRVGASIGANATILCGIEIGQYAMVGAGAVVTRSVPPFTLVTGNPARTHGMVCVCGLKVDFDSDQLYECTCGVVLRKQGVSVTLQAGSTKL
jgi:UDP-2-acetamido-3-amino-2,3-dideoxy-glucuronate N-acetyltransferase